MPVKNFCLSVLLSGALLMIASCGGADGGTEVASNADLRTSNIDTSDVLFQQDALLVVDIEMDAADWDILRREGRTLPQVFSGCAKDFEYTHFKASVTVAGQRLEEVDIRKKGFLGSLSATRPSFKLDFDDHVPRRRLEGMEKMTLNNNRQDPGNTHQCIAYSMFRAAGLAAPRCNFARISVNGDDLGIYSHVDSIHDLFLRRNFGSAEGNLYEGQIADFGEFTSANFQAKNNRQDNDRSDIEGVVQALKADDSNLPGLLQQHVNLDHFVDYWAMESIAGHWDSATGNANNHFVYNDPASDQFYYLPWGADAALELDNSLAPGTGPLYRYTTIAARLYQIPQWRERYHERVLALLDVVWDEETLNAEVDRIRDLTGTDESRLVQVRNFLSSHEERVRAAVAGDLEQQERTIVDAATVCAPTRITEISGSFTDGVGFFQYTDIDGNQVTVPGVATAPAEDAAISQLGDGISMTLVGRVEGDLQLVFVSIESGDFGNLEVPFHGLASTLILVGLGGPEGFSVLGFAGEGLIVFSETPELDVPASFEFSAELWLNDGRGFGPLGGGI
ncbi:CotH kinase family protein [Candidatus Litorirhabdus singularis]|uniref:CotH kinase family protein n=1 Tax=Candidatus Litorirhabdus singularis TaxID=2518993 RepID=UPI002430AC6E|nr:CotH kinase family protein [Candidatus Litorirhabdus singularis]